jgi:hypothetical protein
MMNMIGVSFVEDLKPSSMLNSGGFTKNSPNTSLTHSLMPAMI